MSVLFALLSAVSWGVSDFLGGLHSRKFHFVVVTICREIVGISVLLVLAIVADGTPYLRDLAIGFGVGIAAGIALPVFFGALASGRMALIAPVAGAVGATVPIIAGVVGGERPTTLQFFGLVLAVGAIVFVSMEHVDGDGGRQRHVAVNDIVKAMFCGVAFGIFFTGMHHTSADSGLWPALAVAVGVLVTLLVWLGARDRSRLKEIRPKAVGVCGVGGVLDAAAACFFLLASREGLLSITAGVASLYPVGTALLAAFVLKEELNRLNVAGLLLCAVSLGFIAS